MPKKSKFEDVIDLGGSVQIVIADIPGADLPSEYDRLKDDTKRAIQAWIRSNVVPAKSRSKQSSYGLKHICEHAIGCYISNGEFKGAMLAAGYEPKDRERQNWYWHIKKISGCYC